MTHFQKLDGLTIENHGRMYSTHDLFHMVAKLAPPTSLRDWTIRVQPNRRRVLKGISASGDAQGDGFGGGLINITEPGPAFKGYFTLDGDPKRGYLPFHVAGPRHCFEHTLAHELKHAQQYNRALHIDTSRAASTRSRRVVNTSRVARWMETDADRWANRMTQSGVDR